MNKLLSCSTEKIKSRQNEFDFVNDICGRNLSKELESYDHILYDFPLRNQKKEKPISMESSTYFSPQQGLLTLIQIYVEKPLYRSHE